MANPYLEGNFAPVSVERDERALEVEGVVPPDLDGTLLRNGPNPATLPDDPADYHWFSGDGMVHAVSFAGGRATGYRNRWVRTRALAAKLGTVPPGGPSEPIDGPANTHVIRHAGRTLALVESGFPHALSPDLERARVHDFDAGLSSPFTAHPKRDPDTGELFAFGYDVFGPPFLRTHVVDATGELRATREIELPRASMIHDAGVTATRFVVLDLPVVFDLTLALQGRSMPFRWDAEAGARLGVTDRAGDGDADVTWVSIDPCYVFHVLNAWDEGDDVVLDVLRYDAAFDTGPGRSLASSHPFLTRWRIEPGVPRVREQPLDDLPVEFPRIADATVGRRNRYGYATVLGDDPAVPSFGGLVKYDLDRDTTTRFDPGPNRAAGEAVFVMAGDGRNEDEGWVLVPVYDATTDRSDVVVLDATSFAGPPVATVHLPARIPFGFHGSWVAALT